MINNEKQNLIETFLLLEYIRDTSVYAHGSNILSKRFHLHTLLLQKVILEMYILRIDEELIKEGLEEAAIINKIYEIILNGKYLLHIKPNSG